MKVPTIHLNGTSGAVLREEYHAAWQACHAAEQAVRAITVHGRDYYVQPGNDAINAALSDHRAMLTKLHQVTGELAEVIIELDNQLAERQRHRRTT